MTTTPAAVNGGALGPLAQHTAGVARRGEAGARELVNVALCGLWWAMIGIIFLFRFVCMYVCVCVCVYIYIYIYIYIYMCVCVCVYALIR